MVRKDTPKQLEDRKLSNPSDVNNTKKRGLLVEEEDDVDVTSAADRIGDAKGTA
jgi:hypothetical protein